MSILYPGKVSGPEDEGVIYAGLHGVSLRTGEVVEMARR